MGEHLLIMPKFKAVKNIEGQDGQKCVIFRKEGAEQVSKYAFEKGYKVTEEKVTINYDNYTMSKKISLKITL